MGVARGRASGVETTAPTVGDRGARAARLRMALQVRGVRKRYGLALDLGIDQSTLSRWTNGGAMSLDHAAALSEHLDISLDWLILGRGPMDHGDLLQREPIITLAAHLQALPLDLQECMGKIAAALQNKLSGAEP